RIHRPASAGRLQAVAPSRRRPAPRRERWGAMPPGARCRAESCGNLLTSLPRPTPCLIGAILLAIVLLLRTQLPDPLGNRRIGREVMAGAVEVESPRGAVVALNGLCYAACGVDVVLGDATVDDERGDILGAVVLERVEEWCEHHVALLVEGRL